MLDLIMYISAFVTGVGIGMLLLFLIRINDEKQEEDDDDYEPFDINSIFKKGYVIEYIRDIETSPFNVEPSYWEIEDSREGWIKCVSQENSGERNIARIEELVSKHKFNIKDKDVIIASCSFGSIEIKNLNKE